LRLVTHPSNARVVLDPEVGSTRKTRAPFDAWLREGTIRVSVFRKGRNPLNEELELARNESVELWLDPRGLLHHKIGEFQTGSLPKQVAFSPDHSEIWVTPLGEPGIEVYDATSFRRVAEIESGRYGTVEVIFSPDGKTAYVSQMQTASVFEIDTETYEVRRRFFTGSSWSKVMALSPDQERLYVENWSGNSVTEIDLQSGKVRREFATVATPRGLYVTPDGGRLFVAGYANGEIQRIDLRTGKSKVLIETGGAMRHLVGDPQGEALYADDMATDEVFVVDLETEAVKKLADTDHMPNTIDSTPDGRVLYVSNRGENNPVSYSLPGPEWGSVIAIDTRTGDILDAIVGGNQTTGLDVSTDGRLLAFTDFLDNRVSIYEIPSYAILESGGGGRVGEHYSELEKEQ
jgi:DNA-binding beta-propeller fold protein YncE